MASEVVVLIKARDEASAKLKGVEKASLAMGAGIAAAFGGAVKVAMDFEHGLDQVGAVAGATESEMEGLRQTALRLGKDTSYSASEAAAAMEELAAGGLSATDIINGAAEAATNLAAAGGTDLALAANTVATAMSVWGAETSELTDYVNRLAGAANVSRFGVEDMSYAIAMGGGVAAAAGVDFADFSAVVAATADSFSSGSDAGTSFKTFLISLANPTGKARDLMEELGIEVWDANGNLKSMSEVVQELHDGLAPLTEQQRAQAAATIFGNDAMRTALGLAKLTGDEFQALSDKMGNTSAAEVAAQRMGNLSGSFEELKGSIETVAINIGSRALPMLTQMANTGADLISAFDELPDSTQNLILLTGTIAATLPGAIGLFEKAADKLANWRAILSDSRFQVAAWAGAIGIGVIALDGLLQKTADVSLLDIFNKRAREAAETSERFAAALAAAKTAADALGEPFDSVGAAIEYARGQIKITASEYTGYWKTIENTTIGATRSIGTEWSQFGGRWRKVSEDGKAVVQMWVDQSHVVKGAFSDSTRWGREYIQIARDLARELKAGGATFAEWHEARSLFAGDALAAFDAEANWVELQKQWNRYTEESISNIEALGRGTAEYATEAQAAESATERARKKIEAFGQTAEGEALSIEDLTNKILGLIGAVTDLDPRVASARAQHAALNEELADLKRKGDELTETERERIRVIEKELIPALEDEIAKSDENRDAMIRQQEQLQLLMGADGYGAFLQTMQEANRTAEEQADITGTISSAYYKLTHDDIPGALAGFQSMKDMLSPAEWEVLAAAVGPALLDAVVNGINDPEKKAEAIQVLETLLGDVIWAGEQKAGSASSIGLALMNGIAYGIGVGKPNAVYSMQSGVAGIVLAGEIAAQIRSPSRLTMQRIGLPLMEGIAVGLDQGTPLAVTAIKEAIGTTLDAGAASVAASGPPLLAAASDLMADLRAILSRPLPVPKIPAPVEAGGGGGGAVKPPPGGKTHVDPDLSGFPEIGKVYDPDHFDEVPGAYLGVDGEWKLPKFPGFKWESVWGGWRLVPTEAPNWTPDGHNDPPTPPGWRWNTAAGQWEFVGRLDPNQPGGGWDVETDSSGNTTWTPKGGGAGGAVWVQDADGNWSLVTAPDGSHAAGLWRVPFDNYLALLHEGEAVLNRSQAEDWRAGLGGRARGGVRVVIQGPGLVELAHRFRVREEQVFA